MKPVLIVATAAAVLFAFVWMIGVSKDRERQSTRDRIDANFEASRMQLICEHMQQTRPDDPNTKPACDLVKALNRLPTPSAPRD